MYPCKIRQRVIEDHADLRTVMTAFEDYQTRESRTVLAGLMSGLLKAHIALERYLLLPVLARVRDNWRDARCEKLKALHQTQERLLDTLDVALDAKPVRLPVLENAAWTLIARLRTDIELEERLVLTPRLLRSNALVLSTQ